MTDHPGWLHTDTGTAYRAVRTGGAAVIVKTAGPQGAEVIDTGGRDGMHIETVDPDALAGPDDLVALLKQAGPVTRLANPSLWDALSAAIMRQVIQARHARTRYVRFCTAYGAPIGDGGLQAALFPGPRRILELTDEQFAEVGAAFPRTALQDAARRYLADGDRWRTLPPGELVDELQTIHRVGAWTARTAVADWTGDFAFYDYSDIAVQPAARRLNPDRDWPEATREFKSAWEDIAGNQLSAWTLLTLAWGSTNAATAARTAP